MEINLLVVMGYKPSNIQNGVMHWEVCEPNLCENGGACLTGLADEPFSCECPAGFTDPKCSSIVEVGEKK
ncbi:UNVERIFIED_CONTAM: hypothetical protein FKN15_024306 [Acipenser sinensis]